MRDLLITAIIFGSVPFIMAKPHIGVLVWSWIGYMNPHRLTWGFAFSLPFAKVVAAALLLSLLFSKEPKRIPLTLLTGVWIAYICWMTLTTIFAMFPGNAWELYDKVIKIQLITFVTMMVMVTKERLIMLIWVIVLSIGFFSVKGGIFTVLTGGSYRVWGPPGSFIEENNALAIASLMILPLMYYLRKITQRAWIRLGLLAAMGCTCFSVVGSLSRGAFVAGSTVALFFWWKSRNKFVIALVLVLLLPLLYTFMPQHWHDRMATIMPNPETGEREGSSQSRLNAWAMCFNVANRRVLGAGLSPWSSTIYRLYSDNPATWDRGTAAHSIYFSVLAEHGWIGLAMFVSIFMLAWRTGTKVIALCAGCKDLEWISDLIRMLHVSMVAYATGGAFLQLSYFDLPWHLVAIIVICRKIAEEQVQAVEKASADSQQALKPERAGMMSRSIQKRRDG